MKQCTALCSWHRVGSFLCPPMAPRWTSPNQSSLRGKKGKERGTDAEDTSHSGSDRSQLAAKSGHAHWTPQDEDFLLESILADKVMMGDGQMFKPAFWTSVTSKFPQPVQEAAKTSHSCKEKWKRVRHSFFYLSKLHSDQLIDEEYIWGCSQNFKYVRTCILPGERSGCLVRKSAGLGRYCKGKSSFLWCFVFGLQWVQTTKGAAKFKHKGWVHYKKILSLVKSKGTGNHKNTPLQAVEAVPLSHVGSSSVVSSFAALTPSLPPLPAYLPLSSTFLPPSTSSTSHSFLPPSPVFLPPSIPSSYIASFVSSLKPSSSVSAHVENSNKCKADNDDISMMSAQSIAKPSTSIMSDMSTSCKWQAMQKVQTQEISELRADINTLQNTFQSNMELMHTFQAMSSKSTAPSGPVPSSTISSNAAEQRKEARKLLLQLDRAFLAPADLHSCNVWYFRVKQRLHWGIHSPCFNWGHRWSAAELAEETDCGGEWENFASIVYFLYCLSLFIPPSQTWIECIWCNCFGIQTWMCVLRTLNVRKMIFP